MQERSTSQTDEGSVQKHCGLKDAGVQFRYGQDIQGGDRFFNLVTVCVCVCVREAALPKAASAEDSSLEHNQS